MTRDGASTGIPSSSHTTPGGGSYSTYPPEGMGIVTFGRGGASHVPRRWHGGRGRGEEGGVIGGCCGDSAYRTGSGWLRGRRLLLLLLLLCWIQWLSFF